MSRARIASTFTMTLAGWCLIAPSAVAQVAVLGKKVHTMAGPPIEDGVVLVRDGKIRCYAWSTDDPERARIFAQGKGCAAVQAAHNVIHDAAAMLALCDEQDLACVNRGPLGMGLLTGKYTKDSRWGPDDVRNRDWVQKGFVGPIFEKLPLIREVLASGGRTLAQGALAWLWARSPRNLPIPGARTVAQVRENAEAMRFGPLRPDQMKEIERLLGRA